MSVSGGLGLAQGSSPATVSADESHRQQVLIADYCNQVVKQQGSSPALTNTHRKMYSGWKFAQIRPALIVLRSVIPVFRFTPSEQ